MSPAPPEHAAELSALVTRAAHALLSLPDERAARRPAPGKWSPKEIVGHLVDSASNNHERFVRARWTGDLVCPTYDQDAWVASQRYQEAPWSDPRCRSAPPACSKRATMVLQFLSHNG